MVKHIFLTQLIKAIIMTNSLKTNVNEIIRVIH